MTFKESYRDFQELAREHDLLRRHNSSFKQGDPQGKLLLFAEGALIIIMLERFLRMLPDVGATDSDTLYNLLDKATSKTRNVLDISPDERKRMVDIRNTILHGNFEQAAKRLGLATKEEYFKTRWPLPEFLTHPIRTS